METDHLTDRMGSVPILPVKRTVTIGVMLYFDRDGDGTCKQSFGDFDGQNGSRTRCTSQWRSHCRDRFDELFDGHFHVTCKQTLTEKRRIKIRLY